MPVRKFCRTKKLIALAVAIAFWPMENSAAAGQEQPADLILYNGNVITVDPAFSIRQALAIRADRLVAVGDDTEVLKRKGPHSRMIDLGGRTVLPGLNDSHIHLSWMGQSLAEIDLREKSFEEIRAALAARVAQSRPGEMIQGVGWSQGYLGRLPTRQDIDGVSPDNPVLFKEMGHALWVNSQFLELAGLTRESTPPANAVFERDSEGELTGVLHEFYEVMDTVVPRPSDEDRKQAILRGIAALTSQGITSFTEPGVDAETIRLYRELEREGRLSMRATLHLRPGGNLKQIQTSLGSFGDTLKGHGTTSGMLTLRGIKMQIDGAPPGRTALMFEDYTCCPGVRGLISIDGDTEEQQIEEFNRSIQWLNDEGYQIGIHADGDRGAHLAIDALARAIQNSSADSGENSGPNPLRHYLIHGDLVTDEDIAQMARWHIGLSIQPVITYNAGPLLLDLWGQERGERHMATGLFLKAGIWTSLSTDSPIVPADWKENIEYAVLRRNKATPDRFNGLPEYGISAREGIIAHTLTGAYQDFQEDSKGSLEAGKYADLVIIGEDILAIDPGRISDLKTLMTLVGGKVVYDSGDLASHQAYPVSLQGITTQSPHDRRTVREFAGPERE